MKKTSNEKERLFGQISPEETLGILQQLIRLPTVNPPGDTRMCADHIISIFQREGIEAWAVEPKPSKRNVVVRLKGTRPGRTLHFNGHIDVAPPGEDWPVDPFAALYREGEIWGRGTCDMKSGITGMIVALLAIKRSGIPFVGEIVFAGVADEESGSENGTQYLLKEGIVASDMAVCSEPTDMAVELGNRGQMSVDITVSGRSSHAGRPHLGANAIHFAAEIIQALKQLPVDQVRNDLFEVPTSSLSVTMIRGGLAEDTIPDRCYLTVDRRLLPSEGFESAASSIREAVEDLKRPEGIGICYDVRGNFPPCLTPPESPVVQALIQSYTTLLGSPPKIRGKSAATDASHLVAAGIPTVLFGPGNSAFSHTVRERVPLERVVTSGKVYALTALELLNGE
jgi:succinyl-diaminopimelate desuccinylase